MSDRHADVVDREDIVVGRPVPRETLRSVERGTLVTCNASHCQWQGLFPDPSLAKRAVETHYDHEIRSGEYHFGSRTYTIVELLDAETAVTLDESQVGLGVQEQRLQSRDGSVREFEFPRTTGDVAEIVGRGDLIDRHHRDDAKVLSVSETRSHGLPTWTVRYVERDVDLASAGKHDLKWINECIARDGRVYQSFGPDPLASPALKVVGEAEHQADFSEFDGGASA